MYVDASWSSCHYRILARQGIETYRRSKVKGFFKQVQSTAYKSNWLGIKFKISIKEMKQIQHNFTVNYRLSQVLNELVFVSLHRDIGKGLDQIVNCLQNKKCTYIFDECLTLKCINHFPTLKTLLKLKTHTILRFK